MLIGIDDTDSPTGMCTTYLLHKLVQKAVLDMGVDVIGNPRLVRLNPNIPWRTRGNGAVAVLLGKGIGRKREVGRCSDGPLFAYERMACDVEQPRELFAMVTGLVKGLSHFGAKNTNPGAVAAPGAEQPHPRFYWNAVRKVVDLKGLRRELPPGLRVFKMGNGRGMIGASAAISWRPRDYSFERITYRRPGMCGKRRRLDESSVLAMDRSHGSTFNNIDVRNRHVAIAPNTPCPVLFGVRGDDMDDVLAAANDVKVLSEDYDEWLLFLTNQGTDDYIIPNMRGPRLYESGAMNGTIISAPETRRGGHVFFTLGLGKAGSIQCAAFEPTKEFRDAVRALVPGDRVRCMGSISRAAPMTLNLEKLDVRSLAVVRERLPNPRCPSCGKAMKSIGAGMGYRCRPCGKKVGTGSVLGTPMERALVLGTYEVPVCARRHLMRPLKRTPKDGKGAWTLW